MEGSVAELRFTVPLKKTYAVLRKGLAYKTCQMTFVTDKRNHGIAQWLERLAQDRKILVQIPVCWVHTVRMGPEHNPLPLPFQQAPGLGGTLYRMLGSDLKFMDRRLSLNAAGCFSGMHL